MLNYINRSINGIKPLKKKLAAFFYTLYFLIGVKSQFYH